MGKQARSQVTYARILDAAATEFARHGYANASLQGIAVRTGLTKGALYGHFASKEHLAEVLVRRLLTGLEKSPSAGRPLNPSALGQLRDLTCHFATRIETDVQVNAAVRLALDATPAPDTPSDALRHLTGHAFQLAKRAEENDELEPPLTAGAVADLMVTMLVGAYCTAPTADRRGLSARVKRMWDAVMPAIEAGRLRPQQCPPSR